MCTFSLPLVFYSMLGLFSNQEPIADKKQPRPNPSVDILIKICGKLSLRRNEQELGAVIVRITTKENVTFIASVEKTEKLYSIVDKMDGKEVMATVKGYLDSQSRISNPGLSIQLSPFVEVIDIILDEKQKK